VVLAFKNKNFGAINLFKITMLASFLSNKLVLNKQLKISPNLELNGFFILPISVISSFLKY